MIKMLSAHTFEIDEASLAADEILNQLALDQNLLRYSVGLISCHSEFISSGIAGAICARLPFDVIGFTTIGNAVNGGLGEFMLSLSVLTSDDVIFAASMSEPITSENLDFAVDGLYNRICADLNDTPDLLIPIVPLTPNIGPDEVMQSLDDISDGTPAFGTVSMGNFIDFSGTFVTYNGAISANAAALIGISGDIHYSFHMTSILENEAIRQKAIITESAGPVIRSINHISALDYLESIGLIKNGRLGGAASIPLIIDLNDGTTPMVRAMISVLPEEGSVICAGSVPSNASLGIGFLSFDDIISTAEKISQEALSSANGRCALLFSCIGRNMVLGLNAQAEMQTIGECFAEKMVYQLAYSGGEICPVKDLNGFLINRHHNNTLVACVLW